MQYADSSRLRTEMRVSERPESIPDSVKEQFVIHPDIVQTNSIQQVRNGKNDVIMPDRQSTPNQIVNPEDLFCGLAFGTVPVTATIITVTNRSTVLACLLMSSKQSSTAPGYF